MITYLNTAYGSIEEDFCQMPFEEFVRLRLNNNYRLAESLADIAVRGKDAKELHDFFDMVRKSEI